MQNLQIVRNQNDNANSLTLGWEYKCGECKQCNTEEVNIVTFKIYWNHEEYLACDIKKNVSKIAAKVSFFVQCTKMQLITLQNFNIQACFSQFLWVFSLKCEFKS